MINNPLAVILGFAEASLRRLKSGAELEAPLRSIQREAIRCRNLVQDLLVFSRVSNLSESWFDLNEAVQGAMLLVKAQAQCDHVQIEEQLSPDLPLLHGHKSQLEQVIINLASNALDAV